MRIKSTVTTFNAETAELAELIHRLLCLFSEFCVDRRTHPVIAPIDADDTIRAYFAITPVL
jgi:hypothetical protein